MRWGAPRQRLGRRQRDGPGQVGAQHLGDGRRAAGALRAAQVELLERAELGQDCARNCSASAWASRSSSDRRASSAIWRTVLEIDLGHGWVTAGS
jgi:hypothetical protein